MSIEFAHHTDMPDGFSGAYLYDERRFGGVPKPQHAARILADLNAVRAMAHPISETGYKQRLEDIVAGRPADPSFFPPTRLNQRKASNSNRRPMQPGIPTIEQIKALHGRIFARPVSAAQKGMESAAR